MCAVPYRLTMTKMPAVMSTLRPSMWNRYEVNATYWTQNLRDRNGPRTKDK